MDKWFEGLFDAEGQMVISVGDFMLCLGVALLIGLFLAAMYAVKSRTTRSFLATMALLPAVVCVVIMMVNGNIGAGVAVAGAFSLVRFRSVPGTAREIAAIFLAMGAGLVAGMGYLAYAAVFSLVLGLAMMLYQVLGQRNRSHVCKERTLRITIPEDLDYTHVFDDLLETYTSHYELVATKSTNMGSMFRLTYAVTLRDTDKEKEFLDAIRVRNGNLEVGLARQEVGSYEL